MLVQLLPQPPEDTGDVRGTPPEAIFTRSAPALDIKLEPLSGVVTVAIYVWFDGGYALHRFGRFTLYAHESTTPQYVRLALSDKVQYACAVRESGDGQARVYLQESYGQVGLGSGNEVTGTSSTAPIRWAGFVAISGQRTFVLTEPVANFVLVFYDDKPMYEGAGFTASVQTRSITLDGPAWEGKRVYIGYQPPPEA